MKHFSHPDCDALINPSDRKAAADKADDHSRLCENPRMTGELTQVHGEVSKGEVSRPRYNRDGGSSTAEGGERQPG